MSLLSDTYVFYGDVYFIQNLLIKLTILFLIALGLGKRISVSIYKIFFIALVSTCMELIGLFLAPSYAFFVLAVHLLEVPTVVLFFVQRKWALIPKGILLGYFFTMIVNGAIEILWNTFGNGLSYYVVLMIACGLVILGVNLYIRRNRNSKGIYFAELQYGGKRIEVAAFFDSGNCLKDPYTKKGVHIVSEKISSLFERDVKQSVLIPYQTLGDTSGLMEVFYIDEIVIYKEKEILKQQKTPIGIAKEEVFRNKSYEMILNEEVF